MPAQIDVHLVLDNYATHKHAKVKAWLAQRPRYHVHYTPTYASWLNQVEIWFGIISRRAIKRGSFRNVKELVQRIKEFTERYNQEHDRSCGPPRRSRSSTRWPDYILLFAGRHTSSQSEHLTRAGCEVTNCILKKP